MLKIAVFDSGWGGELFADYLEEQLPVAEIIRIIDWRSGVYEEKSVGEVQKCAEAAMKPYIGKVDVIMIASMAANLNAANFMRDKYPEQKFIGFPLTLELIKKQREAKVLALGTRALTENPRAETAIARRKKLEVERRDLTAWLRLIDDGEMEEEIVENELKRVHDFDIVTIECPYFMDLRAQIEKLCGWQTEVMDPFKAVLRELCAYLRLRGENYVVNRKSKRSDDANK